MQSFPFCSTPAFLQRRSLWPADVCTLPSAVLLFQFQGRLLLLQRLLILCSLSRCNYKGTFSNRSRGAERAPFVIPVSSGYLLGRATSKRQGNHGCKFCQRSSRKACDSDVGAVPACCVSSAGRASPCATKARLRSVRHGSREASPQEELVGGLFSMER